jgi:hypothetical protein
MPRGLKYDWRCQRSNKELAYNSSYIDNWFDLTLVIKSVSDKKKPKNLQNSGKIHSSKGIKTFFWPLAYYAIKMKTKF